MRRSARSRRCWCWRCSPAAAAGGTTTPGRPRRKRRRRRRRWSCRRRATASTRPRSTARPPPAWSRSARSSTKAPPKAPASCSTPTAGSSPTPTSSPTARAATARRRRRSSSSSRTATSCRRRIVGFDPFADVALLEVEPDGFDLHPLKLGDDDELVVGQPVAAIGSPFGEQQSLSVGIVSATDRSVGSLTQFQIEGAIQTDASINPGNSGGPLLDAGARVVGINQQIETELGRQRRRRLRGADLRREALARPARTQDGSAEYAYIGVSSQALYPQLADKLGLDADHGGLLAEVVAGGPADEAGLRGGDGEAPLPGLPYRAGGDTILAVDGHEVVRPDDLARYISSLPARRPGDARRPPRRRRTRGGRGDPGQAPGRPSRPAERPAGRSNRRCL